MKTTQRLLTALLSFSLIAVTVGCASTRTNESAGEYLDDTALTTKVKASIFNEPTLKSSEINVETFKGDVQLSGFVNSQSDVNKAIEVARGVKGVKSVKNDMRVK
jgi:osmotically-inducible protein OsmY